MGYTLLDRPRPCLGGWREPDCWSGVPGWRPPQL